MLRLTLVAFLFFASCGLPRDSDRTLDRIRGGVMRVGVIVNPPWVVEGGDAPGGVEALQQIDWRLHGLTGMPVSRLD